MRTSSSNRAKQGDALNLDFPDDSFDDVTTFHVMTVVPDPVKMMREMIRVCKPGGRIVMTTHFQTRTMRSRRSTPW